MAKKKSNGFFGDMGELPKAVDINQLTAPQINRSYTAEDIDYKEVDQEDDDLLGGMFGDVDDLLQQEEEELAAQEAGMMEDGDLSISEEKEGDAMKAQAAILAAESIRLNIYYYLFYFFVNRKDVKALKKIRRHLSLKNNRTPEEQKILEQVYTYLEKHENIRREYLQDVKLHQEQRTILAKMLELEIRRKRLQGKASLAKWLVIGSILGNEASAISGLFANSIDKPDVESIDWGALRKAGIDI
jgi:Skp family chaperone for outer membrane proteins